MYCRTVPHKQVICYIHECTLHILSLSLPLSPPLSLSLSPPLSFSLPLSSSSPLPLSLSPPSPSLSLPPSPSLFPSPPLPLSLLSLSLSHSFKCPFFVSSTLFFLSLTHFLYTYFRRSWQRSKLP